MNLKSSKIQSVAPPSLIKHSCPIVKIDFIGKCPNMTCPANVTHRRTNNSGCYYEKPPSSRTQNLSNVAHYLALKTNDVKYRYDRGLKKVNLFTNFYNWLVEHREVSKSKNCPNCGIDNGHGMVCLNGKRCQSRANLFQRNKQRFPFNIEPLKVTAAEFWAVITNPIAPTIIKEVSLKNATLLREKIGNIK